MALSSPFQGLYPELMEQIFAHTTPLLAFNQLQRLRTVCRAFEGALAPEFFATFQLVIDKDGVLVTREDMLEAIARGETGWARHARTLRVVVNNTGKYGASKVNTRLLESALRALPATQSASFRFTTLTLPSPIFSVILSHLAMTPEFVSLHAMLNCSSNIRWRPFTALLGTALLGYVPWPHFPGLKTLSLECNEISDNAGMLDLCDALKRAGSTGRLTALSVHAPAFTKSAIPSKVLSLSVLLGLLQPVGLQHLTVNPALFNTLSADSAGLPKLASLSQLTIRGLYPSGLHDPTMNDGAWMALAKAGARIKRLRVPGIDDGLAKYLTTYSGLEFIAVASAFDAGLGLRWSDAHNVHDPELEQQKMQRRAADVLRVEMLYDAFVGHAESLRVLSLPAPYAGCWTFRSPVAKAIGMLRELRLLVMSVDIEAIPDAIWPQPEHRVVIDADGVNAVECFVDTITRLPHLTHAALLKTLAPELRFARCGNPIDNHQNRAQKAIATAFAELKPMPVSPSQARNVGTSSPIVYSVSKLYFARFVEGKGKWEVLQSLPHTGGWSHDDGLPAFARV
ncbi:hypothetical protein MIND_00298400 [Mycena indigotica]|uniref:Uncharacterized protein n=1 Tax=Mycena indigotica TaxID=2126181 RepID=A0A8H6T2Y2_9AGAR|nr:uncharacterized protein MIND_00298400 [Mycena indigotica]KAF7309281.1 hypothetical protein MIND_00298400 [Mycena indigotica]